MKEMQKLVSRVDFIAANIKDTQFDKINQQLLQADDNAFPWASEREGWRRMTITIGVPSGKKSMQASQWEAVAAQCHINRHEEPEDSPPAHAVCGSHILLSTLSRTPLVLSVHMAKSTLKLLSGSHQEKGTQA